MNDRQFELQFDLLHWFVFVSVLIIVLYFSGVFLANALGDRLAFWILHPRLFYKCPNVPKMVFYNKNGYFFMKLFEFDLIQVYPLFQIFVTLLIMSSNVQVRIHS